MAACDQPGAPYSPYLEVVADEDVDAGDDEQGDDELEHWREYRVPEQHSDREVAWEHVNMGLSTRVCPSAS